MKNLNLIKRLWTDSPEKQSPQRFTRYAAMLIMLLTLGVGQMWADECGFWGDGAASITFTVDGSSDKTPSDLNGSEVSDYSIGTVTTSLTIKSAWAKVWGRDKFNGITLYYRVKVADASSSAAYSSASLGWDNNFGSNDQFWQNASINASIDIALAPGNYEIEYYFFADAKNESDKYLSNGSSNYHANFTIPSKNLTVAGAGDGNTVSGSVTGITKGTAYTITATPTAGYAFNGWTKTSGGSSITIANTASATTTVTFNNYSNNATVTASFVEEETHDITVSYVNNNSQTIKNSTTESAVGVTTTRSVSAPAINDHTFSSWTAGTGVKTNSSTSATPISINSKGSGTYSLTANYTLVPCSLYIHTSSGTFATQEAKYLMSYDPDVDAYYYEITTTSSPYYFRFYHNNTTQYSAAWADDTYPNIQEAAANGSKIICDQNVNVWDNKSSVKFTGLSGSTIKIWFDYQNKKTWITETKYTVTTANDGHGTASPSSVQAGKNTLSGNITASAATGYTFNNWTVTSGGANITLTSATANPTTVKATSAGTVRANFKHRYVLRGSKNGEDATLGGMAGWSADDNSSYSTATISDGIMTITANLTLAKTKYKMKIRDIEGSGAYYSKNSQDWTSNSNATLNTSDNSDITFTTTAPGTYTFTFNCSSKNLALAYPTVYTVTYGYGTGGSGVTATVSGNSIGASPGYAQAGSNVVLSYTKLAGYDFKEWNTASNGSGTTLGTGDTYTISSISANKTVYAIFTPQTYTSVKLDKNGGSTDGAYSVTYKGTSISVTTTPAKTGYHVDGYYKQEGLTNLIATSAGALQASTSYTNGDRQWTETSGQTLYTKWAANTYTAANNIDKNGGDSHGKYTATYDATSIAINTVPLKTGYHVEGYYESDGSSSWGDKIATSAGALQASTTCTNASYHWTNDGNVTLYTKWEPNTYTITLNQNGATTSSSPTTLTATYDGKANGASDVFTLTNPEKTGYDFAGWFESAGGTGAEIITTAKYYKWEDNPYVTTSGLWQHDGNVTVYAKWTPKNYTITLSQSGETGYGSAGTADVSATYDAVLPTIASLPTGAPGYKFQGYFTGHNGGGTKYYGADGSKVVGSYTTAGPTTLYAYFQKAEITGLTYKTNLAKDEALVVNPTIDPASGVSGNLAICWTLHYQENDEEVDGDKWAVASYDPEKDKPNQVKFTFTDLADGLYYVKAVLKAKATSFTDVCDGSEEGVTVLDTETGNFRVAGNSTVVIRYQDAGGLTLHADNSVEVAANATVGIKAPEIVGYTFSEWELSDVTTNECASSASCGTDKDSINISATYNTFLTAKYTKKNLIYFNNANVHWDQVYVYFYDNGDYWEHESGKGIGAQSNYEISSHAPHYYHFWGAMTRIPGTDVWYFDYQAAAATINPSNAYKINSYTHVAFTQDAQGWTADTEGNRGYKHFWSTKAAYRTDFDHDQSMYVPIDANTETKNENCVYYNTGYWMNYPDSTGYVLKIYDNTTEGALKKTLYFPFSANKAMPVSITTDLEGKKTYGFKIEDPNGTAYGNNGEMSNGHSGDEGQNAPWEFKTGKNRCGLTTSSAGDYTFTLTYGLDLDNTNYNFHVGVHYPEATGDYRVLYKDNAHSKWEVSKVIPFNLSKDTISYFVRSAESPVLKLQKCAASYSDGGGTVVTWTDTVANLIAELPEAITEDGVYYFCINRNAETGERELGDTKPYEGNFYIRTDGAGYSGWDNFRASDHIMPYSDYSYHQSTEPYSHYFTKWYDVSGGKNKNVKFVVANDYSVHISDTVVQDGLSDNYVDANGWLIGRSANIRFMYNYKTNAVTRRYVDGAQGAGSDDFLKIIVETANTIYVRNKANDADSAVMEVKFTDKGNWIYEAKVKAKPGATYRLRSRYGTESPGYVDQYFKGTSSSYEPLIGGSGETLLEIRLLYDFKTNRLVTAYVPNGTLTDTLHINADLMFVREHQGDITEVKFSNGAIKDIKTVYSVLRFNKYTLNNRKKTGDHGYLDEMLSRYERDLFYVSFPYDVKVSDIIGFGTYGQHWIIEYYDGANRAKSGFWIDSDPNWKFVTPAMKDTFELKKGVGYLVALDLDELWWAKNDKNWHSAIWDNVEVEDLELLFPGEVDSISSTSVTYTLPAHTCTIERDSRNIKDSHWNIMGVPTYSNPEGDGVFSNTEWIAELPKFIYAWNMTDNTVTATSATGYRFKAMHAYMVQYCGDVTFTASANTPASVVARRNENAQKDVEFRLEIQQNDQMVDQTYVNLSNDEAASVGFAYGEDMSKEFNANKANIYTIIAGTEGDVQVAGNTLPMSNQTTVVPVGVKIAADGEYTFAMPAGTSGVGVTMVDTETGIRTSLSALEYTVNLEAGTYDNRFYLEISPIVQNPTGIEDVTGDGSQVTGARKVIIDQKMYIIKDGKMFDAQGRQVK